MLNDFSAFALFTAGLAYLTSVSAYTTPVGNNPSGNPIFTPGLNQVVPAGQPFTITWQPTVGDTVTLVLLKGPAENAVAQYAIVEKTANSGSYVWTPSTDLVATGNSGYGIQLIVDAPAAVQGQYQYSTQFGISNDRYGSFSSSSSSSLSSSASSSSATSSSSASSSISSSTISSSETSASSSATSASSSVSSSVSSSTITPSSTISNATSSVPSSTQYTTEVVTQYTTYCPAPTTLTVNNVTYTVSSATTLTITDCPCTVTKPATSAVTSASAITSSGAVTSTTVVSSPANNAGTGSSVNTLVPRPTGSASGSTSSRTSAGSASATTSSPAIYTGAAGKLGLSVGGLLAAAALAMAA